MSDIATQSPYDACLEAMEMHSRNHEVGVLTTEEYVAKLLDALRGYFADEQPGDDVDFLLQYVRLVCERQAEDILHGDRTALERFDLGIRTLRHEPWARAELEQIHDTIRSGIGSGGDAVWMLRGLCSSGWNEFPSLYIIRSHTDLTLDLAAELGVVDALTDAVTPEVRGDGQLGHPQRFGGGPRRKAFDLLAHLATGDGPAAGQAIDSLVHLCGFLASAAHAVIRLPAHRLEERHRRELFAHLDSFESLLARDPILVPGNGAMRMPDAIRSVLWLSNDAAHLRWEA